MQKSSEGPCSLSPACSLPPFLPNHSSQWAAFSLESSLLIFLLLVLVFPEKIVFALDFNLINFYPREDISRFILLLGLPLEISGHSWRACVGPTASQAQKSHLETYVAEAFLLPPTVNGNAPKDPTSCWDTVSFCFLGLLVLKVNFSLEQFSLHCELQQSEFVADSALDCQAMEMN